MSEGAPKADAAPLYVEALAGRRAALGDDHPDTLGSVSNCAILLSGQGKPDAAEALAEFLEVHCVHASQISALRWYQIPTGPK